VTEEGVILSDSEESQQYETLRAKALRVTEKEGHVDCEALRVTKKGASCHLSCHSFADPSETLRISSGLRLRALAQDSVCPSFILSF